MKPFNERPELLNDAARNSRVLVQVTYLDEMRIPNSVKLFFAKGLPLVRTEACEGGANVTLELFVPDGAGAVVSKKE